MELRSSVRNKVATGEQTSATEKSAIWERGFRDAGSVDQEQSHSLTKPKNGFDQNTGANLPAQFSLAGMAR